LKPGRRGKKPATNRFSYGAANENLNGNVGYFAEYTELFFPKVAYDEISKMFLTIITLSCILKWS
jgi:hypothetical protein